MPILGIDFGGRRLGLAVSDARNRIALPIEPLELRGGGSDLQPLQHLVAERGIDLIVVGLPLSLDGSRGPQALAAERFAASLRQTLGLPVELLDERFTTREAERALEATGLRGRRRKKRVLDSVAAAVLLRAYIDRADAAC